MPRPALRPAATLLLVALLGGCGIQQWDGRVGTLLESRQIRAPIDTSAEALYGAGVEALQARNFARAVELFELLEREHPFSAFTVNGKLLGAFADYQRNRYTEAIGALDRFIALHPAHRDIAYAHYLRALSFYEQIADSQRDQRPTEQAMAALQQVVNRFPDTAYARDARLKMDLARDHLAGREMNIGRFYQRQRLYAAAIGRFRRVVDDYQTTNHAPEALHRLTEIYTALGLTREATASAAVLGHNFPGSPWYQDSFALLTPGALPAPQDRRGFVRRSWDWVF